MVPQSAGIKAVSTFLRNARGPLSKKRQQTKPLGEIQELGFDEL
jgi:hypothetical protein